jgi:hypothetical protein
MDDNLAGLLETTTSGDADRPYWSNRNLFEARINNDIQCSARSRRRQRSLTSSSSSLRGRNKDRSFRKTAWFASSIRHGPSSDSLVIGSAENDKNVLGGGGESSISNSIPSFCMNTNPQFASSTARLRWIQLCESGNITSTAEMFAALAEMDCQDRNAVVAAESISSEVKVDENENDNEGWSPTQQWIQRMGLSSVGQAVMECFHRPDLE